MICYTPTQDIHSNFLNDEIKGSAEKTQESTITESVGGESQRASGHEYAGREQSRRSARRVSVRRLHAARRTGGMHRPIVFPTYFLSDLVTNLLYSRCQVPNSGEISYATLSYSSSGHPMSLPNVKRISNQLLPGAASHTVSRLETMIHADLPVQPLFSLQLSQWFQINILLLGLLNQRRGQ